MQVEGWLARAAPRSGPSARRWRRPRAARPTPSCTPRRARGAAELQARGSRARGRASRSRCRPGSTSRWRCTRACCSAPSRCPSTCVCPPPSASTSPAGLCGASLDGAARTASAPRAARSRLLRARPRRDCGGHPHLRHHRRAARPVELTYGNLLWSALGSGRRARRGSARALAVRAAALARRRALDPACARRSTPPPRSCTSASRPTACCTPCAAEEITLVSLVATTLARLLDAGLRTPAAAALRAHRRRPGAGRAARARARRGRAGQPDLRAHRELLAGDHHAASRRSRGAARAPARRCSARACASPRTGRSWCAGPTVAAGAAWPRRLACTRATSARLDERGRLHVSGSQVRHDRQRRRERRAGRGRGRARDPSRRARGGGGRARGRAVGGGGDGRRRWRARAPTLEVEELRAHCARALAPYKVPKRFVAHRRAAPAHALGQALRRELA